jgi:exonuclease SbcC
MGLKIGRIYIENFKHIKHLNLDFSMKDLVVLDGPNGFGKTTIFDIIELVLSGKISRVKNTTDNRYKYNDFLFAFDGQRDTIIKIEFLGENNKFTIAKKHSIRNSISSTANQPDNWKLFETYLLINFEDTLSDDKLVDTKVIQQNLGIENIERYFNLFYYVQQEDNTYFLKEKAKDRMKELSQLFDTEEEESDMKKFSRFKISLEREKKNEEEILNSQIASLQTLNDGIKNISQKELVQQEYFQLIDISPVRVWDKKDLILKDPSTRELYLQDLDLIHDFVSNFDEYIKANTNYQIDEYAKNTGLLADIIISSNFIVNYDQIKEKKSKENKISQLLKLLTKENIHKQTIRFPWDNFENIIDKKFDLKTIKQKIVLLNEYKESANEVSSLLQEINHTRDSLIEHFEKASHSKLSERDECPLCGYNWGSYEELIINIQLKKEAFQKRYDRFSNRYEEELNGLFVDNLNPLKAWLENYLSNSSNIIDDSFLINLNIVWFT